MSNKSIGSFLSELRKEKGITQKELADYLNVSDKTVSHWECDNYSPDISVIPVLAEFFGVTCDEILRGEKKAPENNERSFTYEPLTKENEEHAKYTRIRLHNTFSRMKLINVVAVFTAIVLWAVLYIVIQLIEHRIGIHNFEACASIGAVFFSAGVGAIISLSSHLKFISMLNMCPFEEVEFIKWRRMARSILIVPTIIFALICIIVVIAFTPITDPDISEAETMTFSDFLESEGYYEVDPSAVISEETVVSIQNENLSQEGYLSGKVVVSSSQY